MFVAERDGRRGSSEEMKDHVSNKSSVTCKTVS